MKTKANHNAKSARDEDEADRPAHSKSAIPGFISFLEMTSLLEDEDGDAYQEVFDTIVAEADARSFLRLVDAKDYTDKLFEERRCKSAIAELMDAARSCSLSPTEDEQKLEAIEKYLPLLMKFDRIITSSQAGRRAILKELFQRSSNGNNGAPRPASM